MQVTEESLANFFQDCGTVMVWIRSGEFVFIAVLGGTLHPVGAFLGAIVYEFLKLWAAAELAGSWHLVIGTVLLVLIFVAPAGLVAWMMRLERRRAPKEA